MYKYETVKFGVLNYIEKEMLSKITDWRKWAIGGIVVLGSAQIDTMYSANIPLLEKMGIVIDGEIDLETLYKTLKETAEKQGSIKQNIPLLGEIGFDTSDIDVLYETIKAVK